MIIREAVVVGEVFATLHTVSEAVEHAVSEAVASSGDVIAIKLGSSISRTSIMQLDDHQLSTKPIYLLAVVCSSIPQ